MLRHFRRFYNAGKPPPCDRRGLSFYHPEEDERISLSVDEHRAKRVSDGADVAAQQLGDGQADVRHEGQQQQSDEHAQIERKPTAQIMFFNGTSETPDGPIEYLANPCRKENLAFSFQMKWNADQIYPGFTRTIYLKGLRYNLHLRPRSALIEVGAQTNTYEEAVNAMDPLAQLLDQVLTG